MVGALKETVELGCEFDQICLEFRGGVNCPLAESQSGALVRGRRVRFEAPPATMLPLVAMAAREMNVLVDGGVKESK
jgi:hypothetical protein